MSRQYGVLLFEIAAAYLAVSSVVMLGLPLVEEGQQRSQLSGLARTLHADLKQARMRTLMDGHATLIQFSGDGQHWQYTVNDSTPTASQQYPAVQLSVQALGDRLGFEPARGMALSTGQVTLENRYGEIRLSVHGKGLIETCSPLGPKHVNGFAGCAQKSEPVQLASAL